MVMENIFRLEQIILHATFMNVSYLDPVPKWRQLNGIVFSFISQN